MLLVVVAPASWRDRDTVANSRLGCCMPTGKRGGGRASLEKDLTSPPHHHHPSKHKTLTER